ncbi:MAG: D-alanyl-D-alanine carboxypeptidase family protein [Micrococcales bacterium]|jgi:D-alanyl-D-alanine carboxypeptidase|nr:D-alanyl-D-alanine carboxypeptidase family protein [Microbacteriaceae bacterium]NBR23264.1 D-alanyl-D-alanine carboxypeptidase family protein [Micrococcales bacterium]NBX94747.1 D-alanyl-D-alanine carboxypeptidase family protein [Actinomycetota bacterium]NBS61399.1 D-alanyl-D-alanine carboxypeptidase family protein [Microbacteriaceae bacterium]NBS85122.1 D-alanyl-D-alanine carboxypeptidase family protein [Micrococcales bacterium]
MSSGTKKRLISTILLLSVLFPSVTNFTPAQATRLMEQSTTDPESTWIVVNKQNPLNPIDYVPKDLVAPQFPVLNANPYGRKLRKEASKAAYKLAMAMKAAGKGSLVIQSAYRSYAEQKTIHARQVEKYGLTTGEALAARPGYSEHQTGWAMDVSARGQGCQIRVCFGQTKAGRWLAGNAWRFGFIIRYPSEAMEVTGYQYEPWHLRYVGQGLAIVMHEDKVRVLEKFFGYPSAPNY